MLALGRVMMTPLTWAKNRLFTDYADGFTGSEYDNTVAYAVGDLVRYSDRAVYECIAVTTAGIIPTNTDYWIKVNDLYIGVRERVMYNSGKMLFEYLLNKWFEVDPPPADQIYIETNFLDNNGFFLGEFENTSSAVAQSETHQQAYLGNTYSYEEDAFTIYVPIAVYTALDTVVTNREKMIRQIADKYVLAGMNYNVVSY